MIEQNLGVNSILSNHHYFDHQAFSSNICDGFLDRLGSLSQKKRKVKIMELIANMNSRLFDALPALLTEELSGADFDGKALAASSLGSSLLRGVWDTITHSFSSMRGQYTRLGQLLGNTVVKWAVCPLKNISQTEDLQNLDSALGTEDDLARYYAEIAYAKWTGRTKLLPGEECTSNPSLPSTMACSIGIMQQDMPEPYRDDQFICPVRPFLPAKQQLEVFQKKKGFCPLSMSTVQMRNASWFFRGRTPQRKQYDMKENLPKKDIQGVRIMDFKSRQDTDFHVWRSFVTTSLQCTLEEAEETPRWCADPEVRSFDVGKRIGDGSKLNHPGTAGFSRWFHLPGSNFGYPFLTHSQFLPYRKRNDMEAFVVNARL